MVNSMLNKAYNVIRVWRKGRAGVGRPGRGLGGATFFGNDSSACAKRWHVLKLHRLECTPQNCESFYNNLWHFTDAQWPIVHIVLPFQPKGWKRRLSYAVASDEYKDNNYEHNALAWLSACPGKATWKCLCGSLAGEITSLTSQIW